MASIGHGVSGENSIWEPVILYVKREVASVVPPADVVWFSSSTATPELYSVRLPETMVGVCVPPVGGGLYGNCCPLMSVSANRAEIEGGSLGSVQATAAMVRNRMA